MSVVAAPSPVESSWVMDVDGSPVGLARTGDALAVVTGEGTAHVLEPATGAEVQRLQAPGGLLGAEWSPDGAVLALGGVTSYAVWARAEGRLRRFETGAWCGALTWAESGRLALGQGRMAVVVDRDGDELWRTAPAGSTVTGLSWLGGGRRLLVAAYGGLRAHLPARRGPVTEHSWTGAPVALAVPSTGRWFVTGNQDASIHVWRARDGEELEMAGFPSKVAHLCFDGSGRWLAAGGGAEVTVWDFAGKGPGGTSPRVLRQHDKVTALAWAPGDCGLLASGGQEGSVALWRPAGGLPGRPGRPLTLLVDAPEMRDPVVALAWTSAESLVVASRSGRVRSLVVAGRG